MSKIIRRIIKTSEAPQALGPYSQAVIADKTLYVSGVLGINKETMKLVEGGVEAEADQTLKNIQAILKAGNCDMGNVVKTTILLADIKDWPKVNTVYEKYFTSHHPARIAYQVAALPIGGLIEMEAIAVIGEIEDQ